MSKTKAVIGLIMLSATFIFLFGCYKDKSVVVDAPEITRTVSFSQDILTIFNKSCNLSGCHSTGGQTPDLSAGAAFNSLNIGNYLDKNTPENSLIYLKMSGKKGSPMPVSGINKDYNALMLAWIKQGAQNN